MNAIEVKNLTVKYGDQVAVEDVNVEIEHPSFVVIMGPNGAGKTTFLKAVVGLLPYDGEVRIFGNPPAKVRDKIGYMPQRENINLGVPLRVKDVVLMPLIANKMMVRKEDVGRAKKYLEFVGMGNFWNRRFAELSGGQQQRVLFARTLVTEPEILILDEPFSATDVKTKMELISLLHKLKREKTVLVVIHDVNPLIDCTDKIMLIRRRVLAYGTIMDTLNEENLEKLYGVRVPMIHTENKCYIVGGDRHV